jgi:hypothetical protein
MKTSVGVVGGGIFGCTVAIELAKRGLAVTLFEAQSELIKVATRNSQNRLHLGLHYPRDLPTAIQSVKGFDSFSKRFPDSIKTKFDNYYALAANASKISKNEFLQFTNSAGITIDEIYPSLLLSGLGLNVNKVQGIWKCREGVIDIEHLAQQVLREIESLPIELKLNSRVNEASRSKNRWSLRTNDSLEFQFDWVVRATYGLDRIQSNLQEVTDRVYEYQQTMILEVESEVDSFGLTIVDGDFLTILPKGFTKNFLVYAPSISTRRKVIGNSYPEDWDKLDSGDLAAFENEIMIRLSEWLTNFKISKVVGVLQTVRTLQPHVSDTDKRTSEIKNIASNFIDIWSGKIDHCVEISQRVSELVRRG